MDVNGDCGKNEERHTPTDITLSDLTAAAKGHDMEVEQAADNMISGASLRPQRSRRSPGPWPDERCSTQLP
jgi:hypothetical protein